jgi:hypothetical protein
MLTPPKSGGERQTLIDKLKSGAESKVLNNHGFKSKFRDEEWNSILYSPIVTFALVAGADSAIDENEVESFQKQLIKGMSGDNPMMQEVMLDVVPILESLTHDVVKGRVDLESTITDVTKFTEQNLSREEATQFKLSLMGIGKAVAESSGGFQGISGKNISEAEQMMLASLLVLLKLD